MPSDRTSLPGRQFIGIKARAADASHSAIFLNALKIGTPIAFGTDAAVYPHGINAQEFGDMVDLGMSPWAALLASSLGSAKLLGIDAETGTAASGQADRHRGGAGRCAAGHPCCRTYALPRNHCW